MNRAYSIIEIKEVDDEKRIIRGVASTPRPDRMSDVVEPMGAQFSLPLPLFLDHTEQVGHVNLANPTKKGISFEAQIPRIDEPGPAKDLVDKAWQFVKYKLRQFVSIGFRALDDGVESLKDGGYRYTKWEWLELSLVSIPAQPDAVITQLKSLDSALLAATGHKQSDDVTKPAGASATKSTPVVKAQEGRKAMQTYSERIKDFENTRAAISARVEEIQNAATGRTKDAAEKEEFDTKRDEIKAIDAELVDLREMEKLNAMKAVPVAGANGDDASNARAGVRVESVKSALPKGIGFARMAIAKYISAKEMVSPVEIAKERWPDNPELQVHLKAAVTAGSSSTMATLVEPQIYAQEFIEYLWHKTILGRIPGLRRVPFNVKVQRALTVASVNWVGEGKPKPLGRGTLDTVTLGYTKIAGIVPLTDELVRFSNPSVEAMVRDQLAAAIVQLMDHDFLDPEKAASAGVSPASITNTATGVSATGTAYANVAADVGTAMANFDAARIDTSDLVVVMGSRQARMLSLMLNSLGQKLFPDLTMTGGTFLGYPVIVSGNVDYTEDSPAEGDNIFFIKPSDILVADDGGVDIAISREAAVQMDGAPDDPASASTVLISAFQHNLVLIRAERYVNWLKARDAAVQYIKAAKYA